MLPSLEESATLLKIENTVLGATNSCGCMVCPSRGALAIKRGPLFNAAEQLKIRSLYLDRDETKKALVAAADKTREPLRELLKNCENCRSLPIEVTELFYGLIYGPRQEVKALLEEKTSINGVA